MSISLQSFITSILESSTIEQERIVVSNELANMRTFIRECDAHYKPSIIAKLMYLEMRGESTAWGQVEAVNLMASDRTSYKRIGYLAAANLLNEQSELSVLITHTMNKDLASQLPEVHVLPLILLANIGSSEMCRTLVSEVQKHLDSISVSVQKRACMASCQIIRKVPDLAETFRPYIIKLLSSGVHSVVGSGITLAIEIMKLDPLYSAVLSNTSSAFTRLLKALYETRPNNEFQFSIFNDPFLQIKLLKVLSYIKSPSDDLDDLLASIVTNVDVKRNTGRSILFQAIQTINSAAKKSSLRSLAYNQIGRLFGFKEPNVLYSALSAFSRILYSENTIIDRSSADSLVLQRYKSQVVSCLDHRDPSIRRRALDVVAALVDDTNVESLIPEVMLYLHMADGDFRVELVAKVFSAVQRFAPNPQWNFDTVLKILIESGNYVGNDVISSICRLIGRNESIRYHALKQLQIYLPDNCSNQPVVQVASWAFGEFLEEQNTVIDLLTRILLMPQTTVESKCYIVVSLAKLAIRFNSIDTVRPFIETLSHSNELELQQRSGELLQIFQKPDIYEDLLAPIEFAEEEPQADTPKSTPIKPTKQEDSLIDLGDAPSEKPKTDDLLVSEPTKPPPETKKIEISPPQGAIEALKTSDYVIYFEIQRNQTNPNQIAIRSSVYNLGAVPLTQFVVQYGLPKGWVISVQKPTNNVLEPIGGKPIQQVIYLENRADFPLAMKTQITYMYRSQPLKEMGQINPIFN